MCDKMFKELRQMALQLFSDNQLTLGLELTRAGGINIICPDLHIGDPNTHTFSLSAHKKEEYVAKELIKTVDYTISSVWYGVIVSAEETL